MANIFKNKKLKIIAATTMAIFTLGAVFVGCYAWFDVFYSAHQNASEMDVKALSRNLSSLKIYELVDGDNNAKFVHDGNGAVTGYNFKSTATLTYTVSPETGAVTSSGSSVAMGVYDMLNPTHPLLFLFTLVGDSPASAITIQGSTESTFMGTMNADGSPVTPLAASGNLMSSVIQGRSMASASWSSYTVSISSLSAPVAFAELTSDGADLAQWHSDVTFYQGVGNTSIRYVAVVIDYQPRVMDLLYTINLGNPVIDNADTILYFLCDWSITA